jgi:hypothetical protein
VPCASPLYTQPPESGEGLELPLKALAEGFEVSFAEFGIIWEFMRVGQRHEDDPPFEGPEGSSVDARQPPQEIPAACSGETPYPLSDAPTATRRRTGPVPNPGVLEGESGYRPPTEEETQAKLRCEFFREGSFLWASVGAARYVG